ncbi:hypothetical protein COCOBI_04-1600 [Coccomyxa sp. Obi]|nr:hypothetical protein COCOBI_04-1600 [Coccomyxa sp. Obi]
MRRKREISELQRAEFQRPSLSTTRRVTLHFVHTLGSARAHCSGSLEVPEMQEGKLLGRVILTCPNKEEILELPGESLVVELLSKAADVFGRGYFTDRAGHLVTPKHPKLDGGFYTWLPAGASDPGFLYVCRKGVDRHVYGSLGYVRPNVKGEYSYTELAALAGYHGMVKPKCIILGDPEIMRIYPTASRTVIIDRSKLGDWGTKGKHVPMEGVGGWWGMVKELVAPPAVAPQSQGVEMGLERCKAVKTC